MNAQAMEPLGLALLDFLAGDASAIAVLRRDDGVANDLPMSVFFRPADLFGVDRAALDLCRGRVLDVGGGAGGHALLLQERGLEVTAIDISPEAVKVMRQRGVRDARCVDIFDLEGERFDTLLMLGHGIGMVETMSGLDRLLADVHGLVEPRGHILLTSLDVRCTDNDVHVAYQEANRREGRYLGEIRLRLEYRDRVGAPFGWLHVDPETLVDHALEAAWQTKVILQEADGDYLAQLTRPPDAELQIAC